MFKDSFKLEDCIDLLSYLVNDRKFSINLLLNSNMIMLTIKNQFTAGFLKARF